MCRPPNGGARWGLAEEAASVIDHGTVRLLLTSPPYALSKQKAYGNLAGQEYVDWLCSIIERLMPVMQSNGSLLINLGDAWNRNSPTVSIYQERTIIEQIGRAQVCTPVTNAHIVSRLL